MKKYILTVFIFFCSLYSLFMTAQDSIKIGTQTWMSKNLDVTTFRNGEVIMEAKTDKEWKEAMKEEKPAWCYYENKASNAKYGKLYNYFAISDPRGLAPIGWKIPSNEDWKTLFDFLGGYKSAGGKMKSNTEWDGSNSSGFNALPSGLRYGKPGAIGDYGNLGEISYYWTTTPGSAFYLRKNREAAEKMQVAAKAGHAYMSVRCVKE